jgi:glycosyltransferase involved in cell wall biosynthesis
VKRRILFVTPDLFCLGAAFQLDLLAGQLADRQFDVHIAVLGGEIRPLRAQAAIHALDVTGIRDVTAPLRLRKLMYDLNPEIVHAWCDPATTLTLLAARYIRGPQVFVTELVMAPAKAGIRRWWETQLSVRATAFVVPHAIVRSRMIRNGLSPDRIHVIPNAVRIACEDRDQARRQMVADWNLPQNARIAATVAPLEARTRLKDLLWVTDTFTAFRSDVYFLIIGVGPQRWRLTKFMRATHAEPFTRFLGNSPLAANYFPGLDFYWHSHLDQPLPNGMLWAMANAIPVIAVYGPGTEDLIWHQRTALAVNLGARVEFGRWTKYLIEKPESARQLGEQGRQLVASNHSPSEMTDRYVQLYN